MDAQLKYHYVSARKNERVGERDYVTVLQPIREYLSDVVRIARYPCCSLVGGLDEISKMRSWRSISPSDPFYVLEFGTNLGDCLLSISRVLGRGLVKAYACESFQSASRRVIESVRRSGLQSDFQKISGGHWSPKGARFLIWGN